MWNRNEDLPKFEPVRLMRVKEKLRLYERFIKETGRADINIGDVHDVSNKVWQIPIEKAYRHPGAVLAPGRSYHKAIVSKGQDIKKVPDKLKWMYCVIEPSEDNKLAKDTGFYFLPNETPLAALQEDNLRGRLSRADLNKLFDFCCF